MRRILATTSLAAFFALAAAGGGEHNQHATEGETHEGHPYETLYVLFGFLVLGVAVMHFTDRPVLNTLPVTVILYVLGIALGLVAEHGGFDGCPGLKNSYVSWQTIDPHLLLFTFLPALLFSDAMCIDTHTAKHTAGQCLILAGPGVAIGAFATAAVFYYIVPYGWDFVTSLMVGSILAATDPVAVVSLLKELGASPVLTMQIQGESMLNDGTAMVLFTIAYNMVGGEECGVGCIVVSLLKSTIGAWCLGSVIGLFFFWWIRGASDKLSHRSAVNQIGLTVCCAYWSYLLADGVLKISGVLSTVAAALVLAHFMWPLITERQAMMEFWHVIETFGNTIVFFLAGMITAHAIPKHELADFGWACVVYVLLTFIRLLTILLLLPFLNIAGQKIRLRDVLVMTWGGLRGMVGLALAILVSEDRANGHLSEEDGDRVMFMVGCIAALTLIINATTAPSVCGALGITQTVEGRKVLMHNVARRAEKHVNELLQVQISSGHLPRACMVSSVRKTVEHLNETVRHHVFGDDADASQGQEMLKSVGSSTSLLNIRLASKLLIARVQRPRILKRHGTLGGLFSFVGVEELDVPDVEALWRRFDEGKVEVLKTGTPLVSFKFGAQLDTIRGILATKTLNPNTLKVVREVFLEAVRASYWEQISSGRFIVGTREPGLLLQSVSLAKDSAGRILNDWSFLQREIEFPDLTRTQAALEKLQEDEMQATLPEQAGEAQGVKRGIRSVSWSRFLQEEKLKAYYRQQMRALQVTIAFIKAHRRAQKEIASYFGQDESVDSPEEAYVILESQTAVFEAASLQGKIAKPVQKRMSTAWESNHLCEQYRSFVMAAHEHGVLQAKEAELLLEPVAEVMHALGKERKHMSTELVHERARLGKERIYEVDAAIVIQRTYRLHRAIASAAVQGNAEGNGESWSALRCVGQAWPNLLRPRANSQSTNGDGASKVDSKEPANTDRGISSL